MRMKVKYSTENIGTFGGLNFISRYFDKLGIDSLIQNQIGKRPVQSEFSYGEVIQNLWYIFLSGGDCAEDIKEHLKEEFNGISGLNVCSPDTILRVLKQLSLPKNNLTSKSGTLNEISKHTELNRLNLAMLVKSGQLNPEKKHDLDFDNQFIPCEKYDSKKSYKMKKGYFPGITSIGKAIVYIENRNGNCNVKFNQAETHQDVFDLLKSEKIQIGRSRMDCGSFTKEVIDVIEANSDTFYIRAQRCMELSEQIRQVAEWETVKIGHLEMEVCSVRYAPFGQEKQYRYVVSREKKNSNQVDLFFQESFTYRAIITNDEYSTEKEVVEYYNQRGASEKIFDEMNNDFGWKNLPFSFLEQNTVYMILMAICRNFYLYVIENLSKKVTFLQPTFRLKKFIFRFIVVPYKWIRQSRQKIVKRYTTNQYPVPI